MSIEDNKRLAARFCELFSAGDVRGVLDLMSDDATYWIVGRREVIPSAGDHTKAQMARMFENMTTRMRDGAMKMRVIGMVAEGDQVALEAESHAPLKNGRVYNNQYHILMTIRNGKLVQVREYIDTQHVLETWFS